MFILRICKQTNVVTCNVGTSDSFTISIVYGEGYSTICRYVLSKKLRGPADSVVAAAQYPTYLATASDPPPRMRISTFQEISVLLQNPLQLGRCYRRVNSLRQTKRSSFLDLASLVQEKHFGRLLTVYRDRH